MPFARQQACSRHLLWGGREVEGWAWDRAQAPFMWDVCATTMGPALRHDVGHTFDSFKSGAT